MDGRQGGQRPTPSNFQCVVTFLNHLPLASRGRFKSPNRRCAFNHSKREIALDALTEMKALCFHHFFAN